MGLFSLLFGTSHKARAQRDQWKPRVAGKNLISPINSYGTCFSCNGSGRRVLDCRPCDGRGSFKCRRCSGNGVMHIPTKRCLACHGNGRSGSGSACRRCAGTGVFEPARTKSCSCASAEGKQKLRCRKCHGSGNFTVSCRKCEGTGWHRF